MLGLVLVFLLSVGVFAETVGEGVVSEVVSEIVPGVVPEVSAEVSDTTAVCSTDKGAGSACESSGVVALS